MTMRASKNKKIDVAVFIAASIEAESRWMLLSSGYPVGSRVGRDQNVVRSSMTIDCFDD